MKRPFIFIFGLVLFLQSAVAGNLLPALDADGKWNSTGKVTLTPGTADGKAAIKAEVSGGEGGFWCRDIPLQQGTYRLKFSYRTIRAGLRVIVKHGDNTYSALDKAFPVSREWKQAEVTFTENKPGPRGSVWFLTAGAIEIADVSLEFIPPPPPEAPAAEAGYSENQLPDFTNRRWISLKGAVTFADRVTKFTASGNEGSFSCREIPLGNNNTYRLRFNYRNVRGSLRVIVKHGNNTYSLINQSMPVSREWQQADIVFTENQGGPRGSVWFITSGEVEIANLTLTQKLSEAEAALQILTPTPATAPAELPALPDLSQKIVLMQEYHMWFSSPFAASGGSPGISVWGETSGRARYLDPCGPLWRRGDRSLSYPYLGHYDSRNPEIVRWSVRVMKNAGLNGTFCQMYPDCAKNGETFTNLPLFELYLQVAKEEGYQLGIHDEIQFMPQAAQSVDAFIKRASEALLAAKKYPGAYVRIDGLMVYQFEAWGLRNWTTADFDRMTSEVERIVGEKIHWMVCGPPDTVYSSKDIRMLKSISDVMVMARSEAAKVNYGTSGSMKWQAEEILPFGDPQLRRRWVEELTNTVEKIRQDAPGKEFVVWIYPGFTNTVCGGNDFRIAPDSSFDRAAYLINNINAALQVANPRIILLSSWNERREKTNFEPSYGGESDDPFFLIRLLARMKGIDFKEPPLPPKEYVDPLRWSELYQIDRTPPAITGLRVIPTEARVEIDAVDDLSGIREVHFSAAPWCFFQLTGENILSFGGTITVPQNLTVTSGQSLTLTVKPAQLLTTDGQMAVKCRIPEGYELVCNISYPRSVTHFCYMLNLRNISTIAPGPVFRGDGALRYRTIPMPSLQMTENQQNIRLTLRLVPGSGTKDDPQAQAEITALTLFPVQLTNESNRGFFLPSANNFFRTAVREIPGKLLPRNFFDLPLAIQAEDAAGNRSNPVIFDITADEELIRDAILPRSLEL